MMTTLSPSSPRLLIVLLSPTWHGIARLPKALTRAGFKVATFCHANSLLAKTCFAEQFFEAPASGNVFPRFVQAVRQSKPDLLILGCELAVEFFHAIAAADSAGRLSQAMSDVLTLVRCSLGKSTFYGATLSKHETLEVAAKLGLRTPQQAHVVSVDDAICQAQNFAMPVVLKGEFGYGGNAVRICRTLDEIAAAYGVLAAQGNNPRIVLQQYIQGCVAMRTAVVFNGQMLDSFAALMLHTHPPPSGPCSVAKFFDNEDTQHILSALVAEFGFTGFCAADFIIESHSQLAYLLEFNPRPTPIAALGGLSGHDLGNALWCHLAHVPRQVPASQILHDTVALFPNEWRRDAQSPFLTQAYHDVPWDDPLLLTAIIRGCVDQTPSDSALVSDEIDCASIVNGAGDKPPSQRP